MLKQANSSFTVDNREATPAEGWEGGQLSRTRWLKTFTGALTGTSLVEAIMVGLDDGGPMAYVGVERFDCALDGRKGTFVLLHAATAHGESQTGAWTIVPGSGTNELAGLSGTGEVLPDHGFVLRYELQE